MRMSPYILCYLCLLSQELCTAAVQLPALHPYTFGLTYILPCLSITAPVFERSENASFFAYFLFHLIRYRTGDTQESLIWATEKWQDEHHQMKRTRMQQISPKGSY